jgi:GH25 family lysozyme M1 (1,4-beta-N-acetylmuramidase)
VDPPAPWPPTRTRSQIANAALAGIATDAYLWVWTHSAVEADMEAKLALLDGLPVGRLWLDAEDTESASFAARRDAISRSFAVLDEWSMARGLPRPGIYTAWWYVGGYLGYGRQERTPWTDRDLWNAEYDGIPDSGVFHPYCGWAEQAIKQYTASGRLPGYGGDLDVNALSAAEAARVAGGAQPAPQPQPDPTAGLINALGYLTGDVAATLEAEAARKGGPRRSPVLAVVGELRRVGQETLG